MKILSLHAKFSSFFSVCFKELFEIDGVCLRLVCSKPEANAPFSDSIYTNVGLEDWHYREDLGREGVQRLVDEFQPDVILTSGWMFSEYLSVCRQFRKKGGFVVAFSDTQFRGRIKQRVGALLSPFVLHSAIDVICVAGERQRQYAAMLGYRGHQVWEPMLCCDWERFNAAKLDLATRQKEFLYVGRLLESKGLLILLQAYQQYRQKVSDPWRLRCIGGGALEARLQSEEGVVTQGFIQPSDLPAAMAPAGCFIFPTLFESWGVVVQEAAALGLPMIISEAAGASAHLLRDGWNGYLVQAGEARGLLESMLSIHSASEDELQAMGHNSAELAKQYTPDRWARQIVDGIRAWKAREGGEG